MWRGELVNVVLKPQSACCESVIIGADFEPADLSDVCFLNRATKRMGHQLTAVTDTQHRHISLSSTTHSFRLTLDVLVDLLPIHRPVRSEKHDDVVASHVERAFRVTVKDLERKPALLETLADIASVVVATVGDQ